MDINIFAMYNDPHVAIGRGSPALYRSITIILAITSTSAAVALVSDLMLSNTNAPSHACRKCTDQ